MELNLSEPGQSRYLRVYEYYKELIVSGQMKPGAKLPSIRKCSLQLQLSRTTVETAYMLLAADGYIISRPQSGFYVTDAVLAAANREEIEHGVPHQEERPEIRYDFASSNVDRESFQFDLWRRAGKRTAGRNGKYSCHCRHGSGIAVGMREYDDGKRKA